MLRRISVNALTCFLLGIVCGISCFINAPALMPIHWLPVSAIVAIVTGFAGGVLSSVVDYERGK